jgi:hypothetical protein
MSKSGSKKRKAESISKIITIWARLSGDAENEVFSVKCEPSSTTIDDLKELVKLECSSTLNDIGSHKLIIKGADGNAIEEDIILDSRIEGRERNTAFIVEVPKIGNIKSLIMTIVNITRKLIKPFPPL